MSNKNSSFIGYEYIEVPVKQRYVSLVEDGYANFGWCLDQAVHSPAGVGSLTLKFKRDRSINDKHELAKMQRRFDEVVREIDHLEQQKTLLASILAYTIGLVGTGFMAASVFSITLWTMIPAMVLFAILGFIGWILPYLIFIKVRKTKTLELAGSIDEKYDELYALTKSANALIYPSV